MENSYTPLLKTISFLFLLSLFSFNVFAQVGIGTTTPNVNSKLDVTSTATEPGGLLLPRVELTGTSSTAPLAAHVAGMTVYNTATAGNVTPGYYYNDGAQWVRIASATGGTSSGWALTGNGGTSPGTGVGQNFLGTSDGQALIIATQSIQRMRLLANGQVVVNNTGAPFVGDRLTVQGANDEFAINGYAAGTSGVAIYGRSIDNDAIHGIGARLGVLASATMGTGFGVRAVNSNASGTGILATGNNAAGAYLTNGSGLSSIGNTGVYGVSTSASNGVGLLGIGNNNSVNIVVPINGAGVAGSGTRLGVFGYAGNGSVATANRGNAAGRFVLDADNNVNTQGNRATAILAGFDNVAPDGLIAQDSYYGGYFSGGSESSNIPSYAYVGMRYKTNNFGDGVGNGANAGQDYKIIGTGVVSTLINDVSGTPRVLFAPEAPEVVFQDYGIGKLVNGEARILIDPVLKKGIHVDAESPLKVYVTLEGDCNGVYVTNKSADGFTVKELQSGTSNVPFSWQIVASRADTKNASGEITSKYVGIRLPEGPKALRVEMKKETELRTDVSDVMTKKPRYSTEVQNSITKELQSENASSNTTDVIKESAG